MPPSQGSLLKLRRPVHRTFHVVAWEASLQDAECAEWAAGDRAGEDRLGRVRDAHRRRPVRRRDSRSCRASRRAGARWSPWPIPMRRGRSRRSGWCRGRRRPIRGYTGEETFPLHPLAVQDGDDVAHAAVRLSADRRRRLRAARAGDAAGTGCRRPAATICRGRSAWRIAAAGRCRDLQLRSADRVGTDHRANGRRWVGADACRAARTLSTGGPTGVGRPAECAASSPCSTRLSFYTDPPTPGLSGQPLRDWAAAHAVPGSTLGAVLRTMRRLRSPARQSPVPAGGRPTRRRCSAR